MKLLSYIFPQIVARYSTKYNRDIRVLEEGGKYKLLVNGSRQSGEYIKDLWQGAFSSFGIIPSPDIRSILVLGVAGGTVIHLVRAIFPEATIDGIDVDQTMIDIGKKYFGLGTIEGLTITREEARTYVRGVQGKQWDMVIIDLYIGASIPSFVGEEKFLRDVKHILSPRGIVVFNYLNEFEYKNLALLLLGKLRSVFRYVRSTDLFFNRFYMCSDTRAS